MATSVARFLVGSDVGGTFTDTVLLDRSTGRTWATKVPTRARRQEESVAQGIRVALERARADRSGPEGDDTFALQHGSTTATNALLERRGARTAFLTNHGFEDLTAIRRQDRPHLYDLTVTRPEPLVPPELRLPLPHRRGPDGADWRETEHTEEAALAGLAAHLRNADVEAVAIGLLHADLHPDDEVRVARALREALPGVAVVASHEVWPEFREVERFETTITNAYLVPLMMHALERLTETAQGATGRTTEVHVMDSAATLRPVAAAARLPASLLLSGPAGGVRAAQSLAQTIQVDPLLTLDMGGTSTDVAFVTGGTPRLASESRVGGYACRFPAVDLHTLGAGGGSVLARDPGGHLQVGPHSQGARPGPACYGLGGEEPTLTDAFLVAGRIPSTLLLAGRMRLDRDAAHRVLERLAGRLRLDVARAAIGAIRVAVAAIAAGARTVTSQRGHDPRDAAILAYGGAGGLIAAELAAALEVRTVLVPPEAGTFSALGMLTAPIVARTAMGMDLTLPGDASAEGSPLQEGFRDVMARLEREPGASEGTITARAAVHYAGQSHELEIRVRADDDANALRARFHAAHVTAYGHAHPERAVEITRLVLERTRDAPPYTWQRANEPDEPPPGLPATNRVLVPRDDAVEEIEARVLWRSSLAGGQELDGPLIIVDETQSTYTPPGWRLFVHPETGTLRMSHAAGTGRT